MATTALKNERHTGRWPSAALLLIPLRSLADWRLTVLIRAAALLLIAYCEPVLAFKLSAGGDLTLGYLHADDVTSPSSQGSVPRESGKAYTVAPHMTLRARGVRLSGDADGIYQIFDYPAGVQQKVYNARGSSRAQAIPDVLYVDLRGTLRQRSLTHDPLVDQNTFQISDQRSDVVTLSAAPTAIVRTVSNFTTVRYTHDYVRVRNSQSGDMDTNQYYFATESNPSESGQSWWRVHAESRNSLFHEFGMSRHREVGANYRANFNRIAGYELEGGLDYGRQPFVSRGNGEVLVYWLTGLQFRPTSLLDGRLAVGKRRFGTTYRGSLNYRLRELEIGTAYEETLVDAVPPNYASADPQSFDLFLRGPYISRRVSAHLDYRSIRTQLRIGFSHDRRGYAMDDNSQGILTGAQADVNYRFSSRAFALATMRVDYNKSQIVDMGGSYFGFIAGAGYHATRNLTLSLKGLIYRRGYDQIDRVIQNRLYVLEVNMHGG